MRLYESGLIDSDFQAAFESSAGVAYSMAGGSSDDPQAVFGEFGIEVALFVQNGPDPDFFARVKKSVAGRLLRSLDSFDSICYNYANGYFRGYDAFEAADALTSVTIADVTAFARLNLEHGNMAISTVTPTQEAST
jgi:predicted Zn-dependent peptidase